MFGLQRIKTSCSGSKQIKTEVFYKIPGEYILLYIILYTYYSTVYIILYHLLGWWPYRAHGRQWPDTPPRVRLDGPRPRRP